VRRGLASLLVTFVLMVLTAPAAQAADGDTWANTPTDGAGSIMDPGPPVKGVGDPFAKHPTVSIYETYGFGFMEWKQVPDDPNLLQKLLDHGVLGLGGIVASKGSQKIGDLSPKAWADNAVNAVNTFGLMTLSMLLGLTALILRLAYHPDWLSFLDPFQHLAQQVFGRDLFLALEWLTLCCSGIWLIAHARKAQFKVVANEGSWVLASLLLGLMAMAWPFTIAPVVDHAMTAGMGTVNSQAAGFGSGRAAEATDGATAALHQALGYQVWCSGLVGRDAGRQISDQYCPRLLRDSSFSYAELDATAGDPGKRADLSNAKFKDYKKAVSDLCDASSTACAHVVGDKPWSRFGTVVLAFVGALAALPFVLLSAALLAYCLVLLRVGIAVLPLLVLIGGFPPAKRVVLRLGEILMVAFRSAVLMGLACTGLIVAIGGLMSPVTAAPAIVSYLVVGLLTVAFWVVFKPHRAVQAALGKVPKGLKRWTWSTPAKDGEWAEPDYASTRPVEAQHRPSRAWEAAKAAAAGYAGAGAGTLVGMAAAAARREPAPAPAETGTPVPAQRVSSGSPPKVFVAQTEDLPASKQTVPGQVIAVYSRAIDNA
jgi:hypothetical protein